MKKCRNISRTDYCNTKSIGSRKTRWDNGDIFFTDYISRADLHLDPSSTDQEVSDAIKTYKPLSFVKAFRLTVSIRSGGTVELDVFGMNDSSYAGPQAAGTSGAARGRCWKR